MTMSPEEVKKLTQEVADRLGETDEQPLSQIQALIELVGIDLVNKMLEQAIKLHEEGEMFIHRKVRKRTLGGIFFYIIKGELEEDIRQKIFPAFGKSAEMPIINWDERADVVKSILDEKKYAGYFRRNPVVTLQGRPSFVKEYGKTVVIVVEYAPSETPFPSGVPAHPFDKIRYYLYIGYRHWQKIEVAMKNPKDYFVAQGYMIWDAELEGMAVFVNRLSTREMDKQNRRDEGQVSESGDGGDAKAKDDKSKAQAKPKKEEPQKTVKMPTPEAPVENVEVPSSMPADVAQKYEKLVNAANTLRARIKAMEADNKPGVDMTRKLLTNTEKQIEALEKQYP